MAHHLLVVVVQGVVVLPGGHVQEHLAARAAAAFGQPTGLRAFPAKVGGRAFGAVCRAAVGLTAAAIKAQESAASVGGHLALAGPR